MIIGSLQHLQKVAAILLPQQGWVCLVTAGLGWADRDIQEVYTHWDVESLIDLAGR
jgi:hypothetical protein